MIAKLGLMIALAALISSFPCSAELVKLQKYSIDTGVYILPSNYNIQVPESVKGIYYEGLDWDFGINKRSIVIIAKCNVSTDPRVLQYALMANSFCDKSTNLTNTDIFSPVKNPYPGWTSTCRSKGNGSDMLVYAGSIDNQTILVFSTTEDPKTSALILENLRVVQSTNSSNILVQNRSQSYNILKYII